MKNNTRKPLIALAALSAALAMPLAFAQEAKTLAGHGGGAAGRRRRIARKIPRRRATGHAELIGALVADPRRRWRAID